MNPAVYGYVYIWGAAVIGMIPLVGASVGAWMKEAASIYEEE